MKINLRIFLTLFLFSLLIIPSLSTAYTVTGANSKLGWDNLMNNWGYTNYMINTNISPYSTLTASSLLTYSGGSVYFNIDLSNAGNETNIYNAYMLSTGQITEIIATFSQPIVALGLVIKPTGTPPTGYGFVMQISESDGGSSASAGYGNTYNDFLGWAIKYDSWDFDSYGNLLPSSSVYSFKISNEGQPYRSEGSIESGFVFGELLVVPYNLPDTNPIPEPATMLLLGSGLIGLAGLRRKFKK